MCQLQFPHDDDITTYILQQRCCCVLSLYAWCNPAVTTRVYVPTVIGDAESRPGICLYKITDVLDRSNFTLMYFFKATQKVKSGFSRAHPCSSAWCSLLKTNDSTPQALGSPPSRLVLALLTRACWWFEGWRCPQKRLYCCAAAVLEGCVLCVRLQNWKLVGS